MNLVKLVTPAPTTLRLQVIYCSPFQGGTAVVVFDIFFVSVLIIVLNAYRWTIKGRFSAVHAGSRGFDSHRNHMSQRSFQSNKPGYPSPVCSELENSGIRVAVGDCSVTER